MELLNRGRANLFVLKYKKWAWSHRLSEIDGHGNLFVLSINKWSVLMVSNKINQYSHGVIE